MSSTNDQPHDSGNLRNAGGPWTDEEDERLVGELRDGLPFEDVAHLHGRTVSAVRSRVGAMVLEDDPQSGPKGRPDRVRELLANEDYDWRTPLRARKSPSAWTGTEDEQLKAAWDAGTQMVDTADALRRSEPMLVRRLLQLGLATDLEEIVSRIGCDPQGPLPFRLALANGAVGSALHVLLGLDDDGRTVHVSVHESEQAALTLSEAVEQSQRGIARWQRIQRHVGGPGYADPRTGYSVKPERPSDAPEGRSILVGTGMATRPFTFGTDPGSKSEESGAS